MPIISRIVDSLDRPWTDLRYISNSYAARITILVPLIGYLIIFNDNVSQYLQLARELGGSSQPGRISGRLLWIYFGLTSVAAGTLLYAWYCPYEVKTHGDVMSFTKDAQTTVTDEVLERYEVVIEDAGYAQTSPAEPEFRVTVLRRYFGYLNHTHRWARFGTTLAYVIGFALLAVPSTDVFVRVVVLLARRIFA